MNKLNIKKAIISVSDKDKLEILVDYFLNNKISVISTGGTYKFLKKTSNNLDLQEIENFTKFKEILDGRVKTLHPFVFSGILAKNEDIKHQTELDNLGITNIDLVVVNLYPFEKVCNDKSKNEEECIENIDIGGPSMVRAAAKNFKSTVVLSSPNQYETFVKKASQNKNFVSYAFRKDLAAQAFKNTSYYEAIISEWFSAKNNTLFESSSSIALKKIKELRYGENPHQKGSLFKYGEDCITKIYGKDLSFNNINDLEIAMEIVAQFNRNACAIIKHGNPCGVALDEKQEKAYKKALVCDSISAFGGIVAFNKKLNEKTAKEISKIFTELIIAPDFSSKAVKLLSMKKNLSLVRYNPINTSKGKKIKSTRNYLLVQDEDKKKVLKNDLKFVTKNKPKNSEVEDMLFAFTVCKYLNSNAIVIAKNQATLGIGVGQTSRIEAAKHAIDKAKNILTKNKKTVLASDGFFPFPDIIKYCSKNNVSAIIHPGGSKNDDLVIKAANKSGISIAITNIRHFKH